MKKTFLKLTSALTAFCLIFGTVASAAAVKAEELKQTTTTTGVRILTIYLRELRSQAVLQDGGAEQWDAIL